MEFPFFILYYIILHYIILYCIIFYYIILYYCVSPTSTLQLAATAQHYCLLYFNFFIYHFNYLHTTIHTHPVLWHELSTIQMATDLFKMRKCCIIFQCLLTTCTVGYTYMVTETKTKYHGLLSAFKSMLPLKLLN